MLNKDDLDVIVDAIESEKCILLLGPELNNLNGVSKEKALYTYLDSQGIKLHFYENDGFFLFDEHTTLPNLTLRLKQFYNNAIIPLIYEKIAKIPFHLFLSITPDLFLQKTFENLNLNYKVSVYDMTENPQEVNAPSKEVPLLYYLFGRYDKFNSMILTHDQLFDFLVAILGKHELPPGLTSQIIDAENFLFLGFRFDHWYVQILLRLLSYKVKEKHAKFSIGRYALSENANPDTKAFYLHEFSMTFIEDSIPKFIDQIHDEFERRNELRKPDLHDVHSVKKLGECILKGNLDDAFVCLKVFLTKNIDGADKSDLDNQIIQLSGRYETLKKDNEKRILKDDDYRIEWSKIQNSIVNLINDIKKLPGIQ
jgi:hypothetical protein